MTPKLVRLCGVHWNVPNQTILLHSIIFPPNNQGKIMKCLTGFAVALMLGTGFQANAQDQREDKPRVSQQEEKGDGPGRRGPGRGGPDVGGPNGGGPRPDDAQWA